MEIPTVAKVLSTAKALNECKIGQEALAQLKIAISEKNIIGQQLVAQIQNIPKTLVVFA